MTPCVLGGDGNQYCDATYTGFCSLEKAQRTSLGAVSINASGYVVATGPCDTCRTPLTTVLYSPPV